MRYLDNSGEIRTRMLKFMDVSRIELEVLELTPVDWTSHPIFQWKTFSPENIPLFADPWTRTRNLRVKSPALYPRPQVKNLSLS